MAIDFIRQLRKKPTAYRKRVLFFSTSFITGVIFVIWLFTFDLGFNPTPADNVAAEKQLQPIEEIKTNLASFIDTVKTMSAGFFGGVATSS